MTDEQTDGFVAIAGLAIAAIFACLLIAGMFWYAVQPPKVYTPTTEQLKIAVCVQDGGTSAECALAARQ